MTTELLSRLSLKALSLGLERGGRLLLVLASASALGKGAFGRFQFATTVTAMLALATELGLALWTTRALARAQEPAARVLRVGLQLRLLAALPFTAALGAGALYTPAGDARSSLVLLGIAALANGFVDHFTASLRGLEHFATEARLNTARALFTVSAGFGALALGPSLFTLCVALASAGAASALYGLALLRLHGALPLPLGPAHFDRGFARRALHEGLPLWLAGLLSLLYFKADTVFLRVYAGEAELGLYSASYKLFEGVMLVPSVLLAVTFPRLARAHGDRATQRRLELRVGAALLALGSLFGAVFYLGSTSILRLLFGAEFVPAGPSLRVLAAGLPLLFVNYGLTHFLIARELGRRNTVLALAMLALNLTLCALLVPALGTRGAAWATVLTELALLLGCALALSATRADAPARP